VIFRLDRTWTPAQKKEIFRLFDLDSNLMSTAFSDKADVTLNGIIWRIRKLDDHRVELSKPLGGKSARADDDVFMLDDRWIDAKGMEERESATYGINVFTLYTVFNYNKGVARFYLPEHRYAGHVYLSGSFNNWSTMQTPMIRCDSGWIISVNVKPGKYSYKYIIDGKWSPDPYNKIREDDSQGGENSVVFCYNYRFDLKGYTDEKKVYLAGSFNGWNGSELPMHRIHSGWALPLYLREGTHAYKFIVGDKWILDPANKILRSDGSGNENSFMSIGDTMFFRLKGHSALNHVNVTGNFNAWNTSELFMEKVPGGWRLPYVLAAGNYEYKFLLDGRWITDPDNPYATGTGSYRNSFLAVKPNHLFVLDDYADAEKVILAGSFNGWKEDGYEMVRINGKWVFPLYLKPGKHTYKFIVDGKWIIDPANDLWENNQYGSGNSVLWIEP
jgi:1,4-alpha-glucan branching enzyme